MATFTRSHAWKQWHGSLDDLVAAVSLIDEAPHEHASEAESQDFRTRVDYSIGSLSIEEDRIEALLEVDSQDLRRLKDLWIRTRSEDTSVSVRAGVGLSLEVQGSDVTQVEGISTRLQERLGRGARKLSWWNREGLIPLSALLVIGSLLVVSLTEDSNSETNPALAYAVAGGIAIVVAGLFYLFPNLELVEHDGRTRFQRFGAAAGVVLLGLITSLIVLFIESGLSL